jgi:large subunit ribosomal protein L29
MKWHDVKQLDDKALNGKIIELRKELMGLRFKQATGQVEKTHQFDVARKTIARMKTLLNQRSKSA